LQLEGMTKDAARSKEEMDAVSIGVQSFCCCCTSISIIFPRFFSHQFCLHSSQLLTHPRASSGARATRRRSHRQRPPPPPNWRVLAPLSSHCFSNPSITLHFIRYATTQKPPHFPWFFSARFGRLDSDIADLEKRLRNEKARAMLECGGGDDDDDVAAVADDDDDDDNDDDDDALFCFFMMIIMLSNVQSERADAEEQVGLKFIVFVIMISECIHTTFCLHRKSS